MATCVVLSDRPPLLRSKAYEQDSLFTPTKLVREARRQLDLPAGNVPPVVVLDPDGDVFRHLRATSGSEPVPQWPCYHSTMWAATIGGAPVGIVPYVVGGPYAVLVAEQAFEAGCNLLIDLTSSGRVSALEQPPPYFVVIERAWRDEGTSVHYQPPAAWAFADPTLLAALVDLPDSAGGQPVLRGASWTTDAPYRETPNALAAAQAEGILAVEMEAASLYAFGAARRRAVLCLAHVTNDVTEAEAADFEKGDNAGTIAAQQLLVYVIQALQTFLVGRSADRRAAGPQAPSPAT
jgi:uridine phosphorylase